MKFECKDLDAVLRESEPSGMAAAIEHARTCPHCREELDFWTSISQAAPGLKEEWESPELWPRIEAGLRREQRRPVRPVWAWAAAAAILLVAAPSAWLVLRPRPAAEVEQALLTEQALNESERAEAAYVQSIGKLGKLADAKLSKDASPLASSYREKLMVLDSAISELKAQADGNRLNAHLREELASLYRDKQQTLKEILTHETSRP
jgi:hypothetical protein